MIAREKDKGASEFDTLLMTNFPFSHLSATGYFRIAFAQTLSTLSALDADSWVKVRIVSLRTFDFVPGPVPNALEVHKWRFQQPVLVV